MWRDWNSHTLLVGRSSGTASLEKAWQLLKWLNTEPHDSNSTPRGIPREMKTYIHVKTCI